MASRYPEVLRRVAALLGRLETILAILIVVAAIWCTSLSPYFLTGRNLAGFTGPYVPTGILALGLLLVITAGDIDISFVSNMVASASCFAVLYQQGIGVWPAALLGVAVGTILGLVNGVLVSVLGVSSLAITLGTLAAYSGLAAALLGPGGVSGFPESFTVIGLGRLGNLPVPIVILAFVAIFMAVMLHTTRWGRYVFAVGSNREVARLSGVPVTLVTLCVFAVLGMLSGLSGLVFTAQYSIRADAGAGILITAVAVVVLGGTDIFGGRGSVLGVVLAFVLVCLLRNGMQLADVNTNVQDIVISVLIIFAIGIQSIPVERVRSLRGALHRGTAEPSPSGGG